MTVRAFSLAAETSDVGGGDGGDGFARASDASGVRRRSAGATVSRPEGSSGQDVGSSYMAGAPGEWTIGVGTPGSEHSSEMH